MKQKVIIFVIILSILLALGWAVNYYHFRATPPVESTTPEPVTILPPPANETPSVQEGKPATPDSKSRVSEEGAIGSQHMPPGKKVTTDDKPVNLADHTVSIKREEKKGIEIMPGVQVKSGVVHVELDEDKDRWIEIERNPSNSNSEYQMLLKRKF
ncbi:hypothetical protein [Sporomusa sp.]|uniref:hypothetical protein n=1 Tax=Sporomusa sp. TaxID=2078658 RepID=UPI002C3C1432|nr:hypothetical protein [Sporomusa sp.]HWR44974.1 hypothetical protein [Sporomusa sp.]